jgi:hypothetical protein
MKKLFGVLWFFCALSGFAQTWTERDTGWYQIEYTVITKDQYDRLLRQYPEDYGRCLVQYKDTLDSQLPNTVKGYYYLRVRTNNPLGISFPGLAYGNSATGRVILVFSNASSGYEVGTVEFTNLYNRYIQRVNAGQAQAPAPAPAVRPSGGPGVYVAGYKKNSSGAYTALLEKRQSDRSQGGNFRECHRRIGK